MTDRTHPFDLQLAQCLADIHRLQQPGICWQFVTELLIQTMDRHNADAIIFLTPNRRSWMCLSIEGGQLLDSTPVFWKYIVDFSQTPRLSNCNAAFVTKDGNLIHLFEDGVTL